MADIPKIPIESTLVGSAVLYKKPGEEDEKLYVIEFVDPNTQVRAGLELKEVKLFTFPPASQVKLLPADGTIMKAKRLEDFAAGKK